MNAKTRGFTLIEMLVSMAIMTAVVSLASYSYRFYSNLSHKNSVKYEQSLRQMQVWQKVRERVAESVDYYVRPKYRPAERDIPLFIGREREVFSVTERGLFEPKRQALYWLGVKDGTLLYCEKLIAGYIPTEDEVDPQICEVSTVIATGVSSISFKYYGWRGLSEKLSASSIDLTPDVSQMLGWYQRYEGRNTFLLPHWIELNIEFSNPVESAIPTKSVLPLYNHDPDRLAYYLGNTNDEG